MVLYTTTVSVSNLAPTGNPGGPYAGDEGTPITFTATATDPGSDDLTFTWNWGDGFSTTTTYPSNGTCPASATDVVQHTYGDNGIYGATLTITDDDGGSVTYAISVNVSNVAPTGGHDGPYAGDEGSLISFSGIATDPGSDDLEFTWSWGDGTADTVTLYFNDRTGPDPYPSPGGTYPFNATDIVSHIYGDNYLYTLTLTICDDDGGCIGYSTTVNVSNVAPTITPFGPFTVDEGSSLTVSTSAEDVGSDDLTFTWTWEMGPTVTATYYNDASGPDPYPSPDGTFPFMAVGASSHTYGDNYNYTLILTVCDDDQGCSSYSTTVLVNNVAPTIAPFGPFVIDEGSPVSASTTATDPGSDDLIITWIWLFGPTDVRTYLNNGSGPDPYPSPGGTYPFSASDTSTHTYGDNYNFTLKLQVCDDDGGCTSYSTYIVVNNVAPDVKLESIYVDARITLRVAGEKWHNVTATLYEDGVPVAMVEVERYPGSPDNQSKTIAWHVSLGKSYIVNLTYDARPDWNPINGQIWGANPVWITIDVEGSDPIKLHHTFNVRHGGPYQHCIWDITSILNSMEITFVGIAEDAGSDDLTFTWDWGDGSPLTVTTYYNNGTVSDPYPSPNGTFPFFVRDVAKHAYASSGSYAVTLTVDDDDGGQTSITIQITINLDGGVVINNCTCRQGIHVGDPPGHGNPHDNPPGHDEPPGQAKKSKPSPKQKKK
jgi:hypothetical protein